MPIDRTNTWGYKERLTSAQVNEIDAKITARALDGGEGGEYDPTSVLKIGGAGLDNKPIMAWLSANPVAKTTAQSFEFALQASVYRATSWTLASSTDLQVPVDGWYSIRGYISATPSDSEGDNYMAIRVGSSEIGQLVGNNYSGSTVRFTGEVIVPIEAVSGQRISIRPLTSTMTPRDNANSPAGNRQQLIVEFKGWFE